MASGSREGFLSWASRASALWLQGAVEVLDAVYPPRCFLCVSLLLEAGAYRYGAGQPSQLRFDRIRQAVQLLGIEFHRISIEAPGGEHGAA